MTHVGIDPSLTRTAVAIIHDDGSVTIREKATTGKAGASIADRFIRLDDITAWLGEVFFDHADVEGETTWAIEGPSLGSKNAASAHDRSGLWWHIVGELHGNGYGYPIVVPPTVRAKYATGKGNAGKDEVLAAVIRRWPHAPVDNNDQADAFVIAAIAAHLDGHPVSDMPESHVVALKTLTGDRP